MALQGTLKDFSITEIIQLIGQQLKTGVLKIRRGKSLVEIYFVDGMIVHVYSNYRGKKDLIGEILVKAQLITEEQLERVLKIQKETLKYLGEILVELGLLTKNDVLKVISTQVYETVYDLFWWEDGSFNFDLKLVESYKKIPFALSTEQVLLNILKTFFFAVGIAVLKPLLSFQIGFLSFNRPLVQVGGQGKIPHSSIQPGEQMIHFIGQEPGSIQAFQLRQDLGVFFLQGGTSRQKFS